MRKLRPWLWGAWPKLGGLGGLNKSLGDAEPLGATLLKVHQNLGFITKFILVFNFTEDYASSTPPDGSFMTYVRMCS